VPLRSRDTRHGSAGIRDLSGARNTAAWILCFTAGSSVSSPGVPYGIGSKRTPTFVGIHVINHGRINSGSF
jgi:hypothetical protein